MPATELVRRDGPQKAMTGRAGIALQNQLAALGQRSELGSQPSQHPPDGAVGQCPLVDGRGAGLCLVADYPSFRTGRFSIGLLVGLNVTGGQVEQCRTGVTLIREYESRGNR